MRLVLLGPPGSGKGTQSALLEEHFGVPTIGTGDMFREAVAAGTELGKKADAFINKGVLVPDEIVIGIVKERLMRPDVSRGFLLDGFPRTEAQAQMLSELMPHLGTELDRVIIITVPQEEIINRLSGRRICDNCGAIFHMQSKPPAKEGICDYCSGKLKQRPDDTEETVRERLRIYEESTAPLMEYYEKRGLTTEVEGIGPVQQVFDRIIRTL